MDSRFPLGQLDRSVESTVKRLDQMLAQLDGYRPLLEQNVSYAEFDIRATFDSLICALGQRQMQLLKQLEKIAKEKAIVIENQKQMIENLRSNIVACMSNRNKNIGQMQEYLTRAESAILNSSSAPFVSFRTEKSVMHQTINSYGRLISQYCGHFADPSQPSSCLPRALEEEDENDESVDCGYRTQSMVFNRIHVPSSHVKPDLLQWLSEEHNFDHQNRGKAEENIGCSALSGLPAIHSVLKSQNTTPSHIAKPIICHSNNQAVMQFPLRSCDPLVMRHWLDPNSALKELNRSKESNARKFSQATSLGSSNNAGITDSESFVAMTGSTDSRLGSLKDWMLFDPLELTEIPGLSNSDQSHSVMAPSSQTPSDWLIWLAPASAEHVPNSVCPADRLISVNQHPKISSHPTPLLPTHLTQSGVVDMDHWLAKSNKSKPIDVVTLCPELATDPKPAAETAVQSEKQSTINVDYSSQPVTADNEEIPDECIYSQCRGGPGGPTCCGARKRVAKGTTCPKSVDVAPTPGVISTTTTVSTQSNPVESGQNLLTVDTGVTSEANPAVIQFTSIASTPLSQWLAESSAMQNEVSVGVTSTNIVSGLHGSDLQVWLNPFGTSNLGDGADLDDRDSETTMSPCKRRLCSDTSDCLGCPCAGDVCSSTEGRMVTANVEDCDQLEQWLLKKLSV